MIGTRLDRYHLLAGETNEIFLKWPEVIQVYQRNVDEFKADPVKYFQGDNRFPMDADPSGYRELVYTRIGFELATWMKINDDVMYWTQLEERIRRLGSAVGLITRDCDDVGLSRSEGAWLGVISSHTNKKNIREYQFRISPILESCAPLTFADLSGEEKVCLYAEYIRSQRDRMTENMCSKL